MAPSIKLTYFEFKGLGETIRLLLKYGNLDFEDIRVTQEKWATMKDSSPFGQMPLYQEDKGNIIAQSIAISRYVAKKVKLTGANDWEDMEIDAIVDTLTDFRLKLSPLWYEKDEKKKAELENTFNNETVPYYLERLDKIAGENGGYLAAKKLTWADVYFYNVSELPMFPSDENLAKYKNVLKVKENVRKVPAIKKWLESRPKTM